MGFIKHGTGEILPQDPEKDPTDQEEVEVEVEDDETEDDE